MLKSNKSALNIRKTIIKNNTVYKEAGNVTETEGLSQLHILCTRIRCNQTPACTISTVRKCERVIAEPLASRIYQPIKLKYFGCRVIAYTHARTPPFM